MTKESVRGLVSSGCPQHDEINRTFKLIVKLKIKTGTGLTMLFLKSAIFFFADGLEKFNKTAFFEFRLNPSFNVISLEHS